MKKVLFVFAVVAASLASCQSGGSKKLATPEDSLAYVLGMQIGTNLKQLDSTLNVDIFAQGMKDALKNKAKIEMNDAMAFMQNYMMVVKPGQESRAGEQDSPHPSGSAG